ncbi:MAG: hypothetical protein IKX40_12825 [Thermoguttaceae bacterium]|nr:hypothetical protein [Thermoguttaceae bacterium]
MTKKAISLMSGGFDSILASRIMQEQGFEVEGLNIRTPFVDTSSKAQQAADDLGIHLTVLNVNEDYIDIIRNPQYGYGKACNPCLDCHLYMCRMAGKYMQETGADCVVTGEVVGQRPKSQRRHHQELIEYKSGIKGRLLRPISAKLLPETDVERSGLVDRDKLYAIEGRGRGPLIDLAHELGITRIPNAGPGCCLTEKSFANRVWDCNKHCPNAQMWEYELLCVSRHVRVDDSFKVAVARNEAECDTILRMFNEHKSDRPDVMYAEPEDFLGASALSIGRTDDLAKRQLASMVVRFSKNAPVPEAKIKICRQDETEIVPGVHDEAIDNLKVL